MLRAPASLWVTGVMDPWSSLFTLAVMRGQSFMMLRFVQIYFGSDSFTTFVDLGI